MAARTDSGRFAKIGARKIAVARIRTGRDERRELGPIARRLARGRLAEAGVHGEAAEQAGAGVGGAERDELLVRVDVVAVADRERARRPDQFGEGQEDDPERSREQEDDVAERDPREARDRDPGRHVTDDGDAQGGKVEQRREHDPDDQRHECARDPRRDPPQDEDADDRADAEGRRVSVEVIEAPDDRDRPSRGSCRRPTGSRAGPGSGRW